MLSMKRVFQIVVLDYNAQTLDKHIKSTENYWSIDGAERSCCENGERIQRYREHIQTTVKNAN